MGKTPQHQNTVDTEESLRDGITGIEVWIGDILRMRADGIIQDIAHSKHAGWQGIQFTKAARSRRAAPEAGSFIADIGDFQNSLTGQLVLNREVVVLDITGPVGIAGGGDNLIALSR